MTTITQPTPKPVFYNQTGDVQGTKEHNKALAYSDKAHQDQVDLQAKRAEASKKVGFIPPSSKK